MKYCADVSWSMKSHYFFLRHILEQQEVIMQEKSSEASAAALQELVEKEQATDNIMRGLNKQFTIFSNKILPPGKQQSVPGRDTGES